MEKLHACAIGLASALAEGWFVDEVVELGGVDVDVEAGEEAGYALVGEAALAEEADFVAEHGNDLLAGEGLFVGASSLAEFAGECRYVEGGVGAGFIGHGE